MLTASLAGAASAVRGDLFAVPPPVQSAETTRADNNLHSPSFVQTQRSLQSKENNKSSLERCHAGFSGKIAAWPHNHILRVTTSVTAIKPNQKNCFNRNATLHIYHHQWKDR